MEALHSDANDAFNSSRNIEKVLDKILELRQSGKPDGPLEVGISLLHPVQPMLAMACKSVDMAFQKCTNGMYSGEIMKLGFCVSITPFFNYANLILCTFKDTIMAKLSW